MTTVNVTLAKALKVKNRLTGRLAKINSDIAVYNSVLEEQLGVFNVQEAVKTREKIVSSLIELKTALYEGNRNIQKQLYTLAETKSTIQLYSALNTRNGVERHDYQNTSVTYVAFLKKSNVDETVKGLERTVDELQEEIDIYNNSKKVEINQEILDLAS